MKRSTTRTTVAVCALLTALVPALGSAPAQSQPDRAGPPHGYSAAELPVLFRGLVVDGEPRRRSSPVQGQFIALAA